MFRTMRLFLGGIVIGSFLGLLLAPASGATITWDGGGADDNIDTLDNWTSAVPASADDVHFAGSIRTTPTMNVDKTFKTLTFDTNADPFKIGGGSILTLSPTGTVITNLSTNTQKFTCPVNLSSTSTSTSKTISALNGDIIFDGSFTSSGPRVLFSGGKNIYLNGQVSIANTTTSPPYELAYTGTGILFITGNNTNFDPYLRISSGTVRLNNTNNFSGSSKKLEWASGNNNSKLELDGSAGAIDIYKPMTYSSHVPENVQLVSLAGNNTLYGEIQLYNTSSSTYNACSFQVDSGKLTLSSSNMSIRQAQSMDLNLQLLGEGDGEINVAIPALTGGGKLNLVKSNGSGTWTLNNYNYYNGKTIINSGTIALGPYASIDYSPTISVQSGAFFDVSARDGGLYLAMGGQNQSLAGSGTVNGQITVGSLGVIIPGNLGAAGTLTINNIPSNPMALALESGASLDFDFANVTTLGGGINDLIAANGNLAINGSTSVAIHLMNGYLASGNYRMIAYTGTFSGSAANLSLVGAPVTRQTMTFTHDSVGKYVNMNVVGNSANLVWKGGGAGSPDTWNLNATANFLNGAAMDKFYDLDQVLFNDVGAAHATVELTGTLQPASLTVNSTANYTFGGTGKISGLTGLTKQGPGKLTLANTGGSDFTGPITISGGILQIGDGVNYYSGSIGLGNVWNDGQMIFDVVDSRTVANIISGTGSLEMKNSYAYPVTVTLSGNNTYSGLTTVSGGTLQAGSATALGTIDAGVEVFAGGTLDTYGYNIGLEKVAIRGTGVSDQGALVNNRIDQLNTLRYLTLAADASVGGMYRWDLRGTPVLDLAGHTMTCVGSNSIYIADGMVTEGNITVNSGLFGFARSTATGTGTLTANTGGTLEVYEVANPANFTRNIVLNGGKLRSAGGTSAINSNISLTADSTAETTVHLTVNGTISGNYKLTKEGTYYLILPGDNAHWTGGTVINAGRLQIGDGGTTGTIPSGTISGDVGGGGLLALDRSDTVDVPNLMTGSVGFRILGTGTATLSNPGNNYDGLTGINNGVFQVTHNQGLGSAVGLTSIAGDTVNPRLELIGGSGSLALGDQITLAGHDNVQGVGLYPHIVNVSGNNTLTGAIDIAAIGGWDYILNSEGGKLTVSGAVTNKIAGTTSTLNRYLLLGGVAQGEISGVISSDVSVSAAPLFVHKVGTGTWTLSGANTYTGDTVVKSGTLAIAATGSIASSPRIEVNGNATLDVSAFSPFTLASGQTLVSRGANVAMVVGNVADAAGASILPGGISEAGTLGISGNLTLTGAGKMAFDLGADNATIGGGVNDLLMIGGDLDVAASMGLEISPIAPLATGNYRLMNYTGALNNPGNLSLLNGTRYSMTLDSATAGQVNVAVSGSNANLVWVGDGSLNAWDVNTSLNWSNNGSPDKFFQADVVTFNDTTANTTVELNTTVSPIGTIAVAGAADYTFNGTGTINGSASIAKSGTGTLTLNTANTFIGTVTVTDGVLKAGNTYALGSTTGGTVISGTGTLDLNNQTLPQSEVVTISGAGYNGQGAIVNSAGGGASTNNIKNIVMAGDATIGGDIRWNLKDSPNGFQGNGYTLTKNGPNSIIIDDVGDMGVGDINIDNGLLYIYQNTVMGDPSKTVTIANNATLALYASPSTLQHDKVMAIAPSGGRVYVSNASTTYIGDATLDGNAVFEVADTYALTFAGDISGDGGLEVKGAGSLILAGNNTYKGVTTMSANSTNGALHLNSTSGYAIPGNVVFTAAARLNLDAGEENGGQPQVSPTTVLIFSDVAGSQYLELGGHSITLEGVEMSNYANTTDGHAALENWDENPPVSLGVLTIDSQNDHNYRGIIRDNVSPLAIVKRGPGTQAFWGTRCGEYTGGLTVEGGTLDYSNGTLPTTTFTITGGNLKIGDRSQTIGQFKITGGLVEATTAILTSNLDFDIQGGKVQADLAGTTATVGLKKTGLGTATLAGDLLYTGNTTVYEGILNVAAINTPDATIAVASGATLNATSLVADTLTIGGTPTMAASAAVPEPGTLALLFVAGLALAGAYLRRK